MRSFFLLVFISIVMYLSAVDDPVAATVTTVRVPNSTNLTMILPGTVSVAKIQPAQSMPPTFKIVSKSGKMSLQITFMQHGQIDNSTQDAVNKMVERLGHAQYERGSVENVTKVVPLKLKEGLGAIAYYTDADLVGVQNPRPDQYKVVGCAVITIGDTVGVITLLGDNLKDADFLAGVDIIQNDISRAKAAPAPIP